MTTTQDRIDDTLDRAQRAWNANLDPTEPLRSETTAWFIHHITTAVLLEHLHRLDPNTAETLGPWLLGEDGIFQDGYAGELLYAWREQRAAGQPMEPIGPPAEETV